MRSSSNHIVVNNPNGPSCGFQEAIPFAEWVEPAEDLKSIDAEIASLKVKDLNLPNFFVRTTEGSFSQNAILLNASGLGLDLLGSCLFPKIEISTTVGSQHVVDSFSGTQNFKYDPNNEFRHFIPANTAFHIIHFSVHPDYFLQYLPENETWAEELKNKIVKKERAIGDHSANITLAQQRILQNILECPLSGKMATLMMETSIVQIILLQLNLLFQKPINPFAEIKRKDQEMAYEVKEYLVSKFLDEHSLESLSRQFGTNTNKLMTIFRKSFGKSLFDFINDLRMDFAYRMLQSNGYSIIEVSRLIGYKNANHFSTAFKKKFGISPSQI